jgi:acetoin utilization deacetylase AcuC-like enzyme
MRLTLHGYADLAGQLIALAGDVCGGRIAFVMEGGYNLDALAHGMTNVARLLVGQAAEDPLGPAPRPIREPDLNVLIARARMIHGL